MLQIQIKKFRTKGQKFHDFFKDDTKGNIYDNCCNDERKDEITWSSNTTELLLQVHYDGVNYLVFSLFSSPLILEFHSLI